MRLVTCALVLTLVACGGAAPTPHLAEPAAPATGSVSDAQFAGAVRDLLSSEPGSRDRAVRLEGVIAKQLLRSTTRFKSKNAEGGLASVSGAVFLMRPGELRDAVLGAAGYDALRSASREFAKRGDEGRAEATYQILARIGPPEARADAQVHLDAINGWNKAAVTPESPVSGSGTQARAAVSRYLYELSPASRDAALAKTSEWISQALALRETFRRGRVPPPREEANEALRAFSTGPQMLLAIHLRNYDPAGAVNALEKGDLRSLTRRDLLAAVERLAKTQSAEAWLEVARMLRPQPRASEDDDGVEDLEIFRAAGFAASLEAYRLDPTNGRAAIEVALRLRELGMAEAAPSALVAAAKAHPDPQFLNAGLAITMASMETELEVEDNEAARRAFAAAKPVLELAKKSGAKLPASPARVMALMGEIELREGNLEGARSYFAASAAEERNAAVDLALARIDVHDHKNKEAAVRLREALARPETRDPETRAEMWIALSDVVREGRDAGAVKEGRDALITAVKELKGAQNRVRMERLYAQVLDRFGAKDAATKALDRALDGATKDKRVLASVIGQVIARAFVRKDLPTAQGALARALSADVDAGDLVYCALWVRLLEKQLKAPPEGSADRLLGAGTDDVRWVGRVAAFGAGQLKGADLVGLAKTRAQKTEALFYLAMEKRIAGDRTEADTLKQVPPEGGIDLAEYAMARDLLPETRVALGPAPALELP